MLLQKKTILCCGVLLSVGMKLANHSFHHESWLKTYSKEKIDEGNRDIAEEAILKATGKRTNMFRGPWILAGAAICLEVLQKRNYIFDASTIANIYFSIDAEILFLEIKIIKRRKRK